MNFVFSYAWILPRETLGEYWKPHWAEQSHPGIYKTHTHTHTHTHTRTSQTSTKDLSSPKHVLQSQPSIWFQIAPLTVLHKKPKPSNVHFQKQTEGLFQGKDYILFNFIHFINYLMCISLYYHFYQFLIFFKCVSVLRCWILCPLPHLSHQACGLYRVISPSRVLFRNACATQQNRLYPWTWPGNMSLSNTASSSLKRREGWYPSHRAVEELKKRVYHTLGL